MERIGFVGLGHMGLPMALNLIKAGYEVTGFDVQPHAMRALQQGGGKTADSLKSLAQDKDVLITMLQTGQQVLSVCGTGDGLFAHTRKNSLFIDCSTIDVQSARQVHDLATTHGLLVVDAPVSGGVAGAAAGTLTFMVGGDEHAFAKARVILSAMGQRIIHTGPAGSGEAAKICNNMILGISMIAISEAFVLAKQLGLSEEKLFEVVNNASGQCWAMSKYAPVPGLLDGVPANKDYQPGFAAAMMLKDLRLSQDCAQSVAVETPLGEQTTKLYQAFVEQGHGQLDFSAIIKLLQHEA